ncbi:MAG: YraN family protein [Patescibacteria group bacterium]|jgi:putative endonuclease
MEGYKIKIGKYGEDLASDFLTRRGARIVERNYYTRYGEIDLIALTGDEILFVEVKTRTGSGYGYPEQAINYFKVRHLHKAIQIYLQDKHLDNFWRLDGVSVELDCVSKTAKIRWFKDVGTSY